ncbi:hypothetical protein [uncultured Roseobacter sp.]|uniref:hypothetical protein n=1 Tax=uncultured Roseobacter sp. TaxID=114847 RepID=UPI00261C3494|nr:hypothetical protein [uncultured Roseobacter sp.]
MSAQRWEKLGRIYDPERADRHPKLATHAANPLALHLEGDIYRVFYSGRDAENRSSVGAVDVDIVARKVMTDPATPLFLHGPAGSFHEAGVSIGNCYTAADGARYVLFMAWQTPAGAHWRGDVGRLRLTEDMTFELTPSEPFMGIDDVDPISLSYPWVHRTPSGHYQMWYGSTRTWDAGNGEMLHVLNHASSPDGLTWSRHGLAVPFDLGVAQAFSRPSVAAHPEGGLEMWFSFRGAPGIPYRIGYARAEEGKTWQLVLQNAGIPVSDTGWDSEMIEYPFVFDHRGARYMLYNGNGHGRSGFGLAVLHRD